MSIADKLKKQSTIPAPAEKQSTIQPKKAAPAEKQSTIQPKKAAQTPNATEQRFLKKISAPISHVEQGASILSGEQKTYTQDVDIFERLASNTRRLRGGSSTGAKPMLRRLLGTPVVAGDSYIFPKFTIEELCKITGKGEVNIRTALTDLRSSKYCGNGGPLFTVIVKVDGHSFYQYDPEKIILELQNVKHE